MQLFVLCFFVIAILCLVQGLRKSSFGQPGASKQHCAICGWTKEEVQLCQVTQYHQTKITSLCPDCSKKYHAIPVRGTSAGTARTACV